MGLNELFAFFSLHRLLFSPRSPHICLPLSGLLPSSSCLHLQVPVDDLYEASQALIKALLLRQKYMNLSRQHYHRTTARYLSMLVNNEPFYQLDNQDRIYNLVHSPAYASSGLRRTLLLLKYLSFLLKRRVEGPSKLASPEAVEVLPWSCD
ncbi:unnamed protein product [Protopolystoma xenopodis]|uniref:Uncharacterized protein n=1 Tax=Protopolystoma xenopodis TaxID=117903 RepID=A0A448XC28_9PLAT|nr:unnamed protein product [Protopolystoma xenopodis]